MTAQRRRRLCRLPPQKTTCPTDSVDTTASHRVSSQSNLYLKSNSRHKRLQRSTLTEKRSRPKRSDMSQPPHTVLLRKRKPCKEWTASMMRTRAQQDVLHIMLTFLVGGEQVVLSIRRRAKRLWLHNSLVTDGAFPYCCVHSNASAGRLAGSSDGLPTRPTLFALPFASFKD